MRHVHPTYHGRGFCVINTNLNMNKIMGVATPIMLAWCSFTPPMHSPCMMQLAPLHRMPCCATPSKHPTSKQHIMARFVVIYICYIKLGAMYLLSMACNEEYLSRVILHAHGGMQGCVGECVIEYTTQGHVAQYFLA